MDISIDDIGLPHGMVFVVAPNFCPASLTLPLPMFNTPTRLDSVLVRVIVKNSCQSVTVTMWQCDQTKTEKNKKPCSPHSIQAFVHTIHHQLLFFTSTQGDQIAHGQGLNDICYVPHAALLLKSKCDRLSVSNRIPTTPYSRHVSLLLCLRRSKNKKKCPLPKCISFNG